jgi:hypothetical protein
MVCSGGDAGALDLASASFTAFCFVSDGRVVEDQLTGQAPGPDGRGNGLQFHSTQLEGVTIRKGEFEDDVAILTFAPGGLTVCKSRFI